MFPCRRYRFVLRTLQDIRPAELDQALLSLPFTDAVALINHLHHVLRRGVATELACKCVLFLLKIHHKQVGATSGVPLRVCRCIDCGAARRRWFLSLACRCRLWVVARSERPFRA